MFASVQKLTKTLKIIKMNMISCKKSSQLHINASITNMKHTTRVECEKV